MADPKWIDWSGEWPYLLYGGVVGLTLFVAYLEFSPKIGNIWWRNNYFNPIGIWQFVQLPLSPSNLWVWWPYNWDLNWIPWSWSGSVSALILHKYIN